MAQSYIKLDIDFRRIEWEILVTIRAKAQAECLIQGKMGIVSCPTLSSDYFCLKYFGFVYDQSLQWKSSLDSVRHWSSNFFDCETGCLQCFLFGKQNNGTKTKFGLSTFHQMQHKLFLNLVGKCGGILIFFSLRKTFLNPSECNLSLADLVT